VERVGNAAFLRYWALRFSNINLDPVFSASSKSNCTQHLFLGSFRYLVRLCYSCILSLHSAIASLPLSAVLLPSIDVLQTQTERISFTQTIIIIQAYERVPFHIPWLSRSGSHFHFAPSFTQCSVMIILLSDRGAMARDKGYFGHGRYIHINSSTSRPLI
jgi:hypothetical protein